MPGNTTKLRLVMTSVLTVTCSVATSLFEGVVSADEVAVKARSVTYVTDIRPLLDEYCVDCHSGWFPDGGLRLNTIDAIRKGGNSGPAIVPGFPEKGWLMYSLSATANQRMQMPPNGERLSQPQIDLIKEWLKQGAK